METGPVISEDWPSGMGHGAELGKRLLIPVEHVDSPISSPFPCLFLAG